MTNLEIFQKIQKIFIMLFKKIKHWWWWIRLNDIEKAYWQGIYKGLGVMKDGKFIDINKLYK